MVKRSWITISLFFLLVTAAAGTALRGMIVGMDTGVSYSHLLHAHSHIAILGWAYGGLFLLMVHSFQLTGAVFRRLFIFSQLTALAMFPAFTVQGYAAVSIALSTVHILLSYWFAAAAWKRLYFSQGKSGIAVLLAKVSLISLVLSSAGVWSVAVVSATGGKGSTLYNMALYFFLHFQYNGWLTIGLLAVLLVYLAKKGMKLNSGRMAIGCWMYAASLVPSYLLSVLWVDAGIVWNGIAFASAVIQWAAVVLISREVYLVQRLRQRMLPAGTSGFLRLAGLAILAKATMELGLLFPALWDLIYESRSIVIGYLHLVLLGFISFLLLALLLAQGLLDGSSSLFRVGSASFITGFVLNEAALFLQGLADWTGGSGVPFFNEILLAAALLMAAGACCWLVSKQAPIKG